MKHSFKKAVSVLLSVLMLVSLCTVAITSVSAEEIKLSDFGLYSGTGVMDSGSIITDLFVEDPAGTGDTVIKTRYGYGRFNLRLADPEDTTQAFVAEKGKYYTITFDYMVDAVGSSTNDFGFQAFYGLKDEGTALGGNKGRVEISTNALFGVSNKFIGDGKWHSAALSFTAAPTTYTINEGTETEQTEVLNNIYLTYYSTVGIDGYLKNITIVEETAKVSYSNNEVYLNHFFNEDGTANTEKFVAMADNGSAAPMTSSYVKDGDYVFVPVTDGLAQVITNTQTVITSDYFEVLNKSGSTYKATGNGGAYNGYYAIKYKVTKLGDSGKAYIGVGRASTSDAGIAANQTCVYNSIEITATSDEWRTVVLSMANNSAGGDLRIALGGAGSEIVIGSVTYAYTGLADSVVLTTFNDNGGDQTIIANYKGTDFGHLVEDGANAENLAMGEKFMGWYSDPNFTTPVTKTPDTSSTVYARYPSVIVDFNYRTAFTDGYGRAVTMTVDNVAGNVKVPINTSGFMIPSYDADIADNDGTQQAFYMFKEGTKYKLTYVFDSVEAACKSRRYAALYSSNNCGTTNARDTGSGIQGDNFSIAASEVETTVSTEFTFDISETSSSFISKGITVGEGDADDVFSMNTSFSSAVSGKYVYYDKFIITECSDETASSIPATIVFDNGETTDSITAYAGDLVVMPEAPEKEGMLFIGWYIDSYDPTVGNNKSTDSIPQAAINVTLDMAGNTTTYVAKYISTETETVDFEESEYQGNDFGGNAWSETVPDGDDENTTPDSNRHRSGYWKITTDEGSEDHYAYINTGTSANFWKLALFDEYENYIPAYEGVSYEITIKYEVVASGKSTDQAIGIVRNDPTGYLPIALDGVGQGETQFGTAATLGEDTVTKTVRVENIYEAFNGSRASGAYTCSTVFSVLVRSGEVKIHEVSITPVDYTAPALHEIDLTKGNVDIDYANGTVTVTPNDGYEVSAAGITARQNYKDYTVASNTATITETEVETFNLMPTKDGGSTDDGLTFKFNTDIEGTKLSTYQFYVDFVEKNDATVNAATIGWSVRPQSGSGDTYTSAGIRFRFRASEQTVANADKVEFVIVPTAALGENDIATYMAGDDTSAAVTGAALDATKHIVYENVGTYYDYQAILTGLTDENGKDLTGLKLSVALRVTVGDAVTYVESGASVCYDDYFAN